MADIRRSVLEDLIQGRNSSLSTQEMMIRMTAAGSRAEIDIGYRIDGNRLTATDENL